MNSTGSIVRSQVTLTTSESKRLIARAIIKSDIFDRAYKKGKIIIHPSSTTYFILKELNIVLPDKVWVIGMITPDGGYRESNCQVKSTTLRDPFEFRHSWILKDGKLQKKKTLKEILEDMTPEDIYIKGANALDCKGISAVLIGSEAGGTISRVIAYSKKRNFKILVPIGLEKLIPCSVIDASKEAGVKKMNFSMGMPCGLLPIRDGYVTTEIEAIKILSGADAFPIASGGLGEAQGAITMVIKGNKEQIELINNYINGIKGTKLPNIEYER